MKKNRGFTLVELLVVMAIIAILASIVVPNVVRYISRARLTRAISEVSGMELSMTAILTDAGRGNLSQLFNKNAALTMFLNSPSAFDMDGDGIADIAFPSGLNGWPQTVDDPNMFNPELFEAASNVYARVAYDLLRMGRDCLRSSSQSVVPAFIIQDTLAKLGTNYMDVGLDSWGQVYRMWPGPWRYSTVGDLGPGERWPIPFRIFSVEATTGAGASSFAVKRDNFILRGGKTGFIDDGVAMMAGVIEDYETWPTQVGLPADAGKPVYIWSYGDNNASSQMLYKAVYDVTDPFDWYNTNSAADIAGGDDINNWDSGNSWQRFYQ